MFDLSQVMADAQKAKNSQNEGGNNQGYKLIYPQNGTLKVKLLFNPKSGLVSRKVLRHNVEGTKTACLSMYGQDCPVCQAVTSIQNSKGIDLWKLKASTRGISFAQYIESDYRWDNPKDAPKKGDIILLMYPWTVYQDINKIIADAGQLADTVVARNSGRIVKISRWVESNQTKYRAELDAFAGEYQSCASDEEFAKVLNEMESLNERIVPPAVTDELLKTAKEVSNQLNSHYLGQQINYSAPPQPQGFGGFNPQGGQAPQQPQGFNGGFNPQQPVGGFNPQQPSGGQAPQGFGGFNPQQAQGFSPQNPSQGFNPQMGFNPQQPPVGGFAPQTPGVGSTGTPAPSKPDNAPECYGKHGDPSVNPNACTICPFELLCSNSK